MSSDAVYGAIKDYLTANWATTPIRWGNENFDPPADPPSPWIAVTISGTTYGQQSIGAGTQAANRWDEDGLLWLYVLVPSGTGELTARALGRQLEDLFRGLTLLAGSLEFRDSHKGQGGPSSERGNWYEIPVALEWRRIDA